MSMTIDSTTAAYNGVVPTTNPEPTDPVEAAAEFPPPPPEPEEPPPVQEQEPLPDPSLEDRYGSIVDEVI